MDYGDRVELANLNRAMLDCRAYGDTSCRGVGGTAAATPPVGVTARTSPTSVTVNWGASISRGGTPITGYTATAFAQPNGGAPIGTCTASGAERACAFPGSIGTTYYLEVVAHNAVGTSAPSSPRMLATPRTAPNAPGAIGATPLIGGIQVSWTATGDGGAPVTKFTAAAYTAGTGGVPSGMCSAAAGGNTCTITGLARATQYFLDVTATNRVGTSAPSSPRTPIATLPGAAQRPTTYAKRKVTVRWDRIQLAAGRQVSGFEAKVYTAAAGGKLVAQCKAGPTASKCTTKRTKKQYRRLWVDLAVIGPVGSQSLTPRIETGTARRAGAPVAVAASSAGGRVTATWAAPGFTGYDFLKSYRARLYSKASGGKPSASCTKSAAYNACTTKKLKVGRSYYMAVSVRSSKGWSANSRPRVAVRVS